MITLKEMNRNIICVYASSPIISSSQRENAYTFFRLRAFCFILLHCVDSTLNFLLFIISVLYVEIGNTYH